MDATLLHIFYGFLLLAAGLGAGLVNTLASSGSAISLPVLLMFGLSPLDANATNRLAVLFATMMAVRTFQAKRLVDWNAGWKMAIPTVLGSVAGVLAAESMGRRDMALAITAAVVAALILLLTKMKKVLEQPAPGVAGITTAGLFVLFAVGFWLGLIAIDGATYLLLVMVLLFHYDLVHANALKALLGFLSTLVPVVLFAGHGSIHWPMGLTMSAGSMCGGYLGARLTMHAQAKVWIFRILVVVLVLEIIHLGIQYVAPLIHPVHALTAAP
ncbi:MAG TPA: sulfite exporter TauE/SafE family protein [Acidobacteriaceae bacterium]|nr:sulfite exporter TauE/SafE family protein [Acidobacteriaceae bacterium]